MQNFARNSALVKILGLAKMHNFAKIAKIFAITAKFSQSQRNFRNLSEIPGIADSSLLCLLLLFCIDFHHFAFILSLIFGLIDGRQLSSIFMVHLLHRY